MKIIVTESQYSTLLRRYASNLPIEEMVDYFLDFLPIEKYKTFESFYSKIKNHVTFRIKHDMLNKGTVSTTDYVNNETQEVSKVEEQVNKYIDNNLKDKIEEYYTKHSKKRKKNKNLQESIIRILREEIELAEKWSEKYKKSINCNNPKGFSQRAHCNGKRKSGEMKENELTEKCWAGYTQKGMKTMFGKRYPNCVKKTK